MHPRDLFDHEEIGLTELHHAGNNTRVTGALAYTQHLLTDH